MFIFGEIFGEYSENYNSFILTSEKTCKMASCDVLMQFTGLFDSKGKEIYEGDILEFNQESDAPNFRWVSEVVFEDEAWKLKNVRYRNYLTSISNPVQYLKIVGNVYENPELLDNE